MVRGGVRAAHHADPAFLQQFLHRRQPQARGHVYCAFLPAEAAICQRDHQSNSHVSIHGWPPICRWKGCRRSVVVGIRRLAAPTGTLTPARQASRRNPAAGISRLGSPLSPTPRASARPIAARSSAQRRPVPAVPAWKVRHSLAVPGGILMSPQIPSRRSWSLELLARTTRVACSLTARPLQGSAVHCEKSSFSVVSWAFRLDWRAQQPVSLVRALNPEKTRGRQCLCAVRPPNCS